MYWVKYEKDLQFTGIAADKPMPNLTIDWDTEGNLTYKATGVPYSSAGSFEDEFYTLDLYYYDNGKEHSSFTKPKKVVVKYRIAQVSDVTAAQLVRYFKKSGHKFPRYYKKTDTPTLKKFCQAYIDECADEGIDAKVAFVQSMLETGWLKFGGSVSIRQNNFAGLGAVGGGVKGNSFKTVKKGIRAQIQHLKAYATKKPLNKKCVDKRYKYVNRGCAPYVEWLGIGDNPTGNGWCAGSGYGYTIVKMIHKI